MGEKDILKKCKKLKDGKKRINYDFYGYEKR